MNEYESLSNGYKQRLEKTLLDYLDCTDVPAIVIKDAMHYMLFPPGKALRPLLVYLSGALSKVPLGCLDVLAASVELMHCYSLIHDDLPAMDNDDFRRGKPSCHRAFDEATAILVGDAMQALAIEILLKRLPEFLSYQTVTNIALELLHATGASGMISGQSLDLSELDEKDVSENVSENTLRTIHALKTGKLILASVNMTLLAGSLPPADQLALQNFARELGLVFQMQDDYLDAYAPVELMGKKRASDSANKKMTFAGRYSQSDLLALINHHYALATEALKPFGEEARPLLELTQLLSERSGLCTSS